MCPGNDITLDFGFKHPFFIRGIAECICKIKFSRPPVIDRAHQINLVRELGILRLCFYNERKSKQYKSQKSCDA